MEIKLLIIVFIIVFSVSSIFLVLGAYHSKEYNSKRKGLKNKNNVRNDIST